jgi:hypothetical protein
MTDRENQRRLDALAMRYLNALDTSDFATIEALWRLAEQDLDLGEMLHGLNAELVADKEVDARTTIGHEVVAAVEKHMPSAEVVRPVAGPLTVAEVAEHIRRNPPRGLTTDDLRLNDVLRTLPEVVPAELGVSQVVEWGRQFGVASEAYWKAFRAAALKLRMQRESAENYQMAARPGKPKSAEGKS